MSSNTITSKEIYSIWKTLLGEGVLKEFIDSSSIWDSWNSPDKPKPVEKPPFTPDMLVTPTTSSVFDLTLVKLVKERCRQAVEDGKEVQPDLPWQSMYIAGGFIASCIQQEDPRDVDIYFKTRLAMKSAKDILLPQLGLPKDFQFPDDGVYRTYLTKDGLRQISEWAISILPDSHQFIIGVYGFPADVKNTFDYVHTMSHYDIAEDKLYLSEAQYLAARQKKLIVNNQKSWAEYREKKFLKRGYTVDKPTQI
jgi:hypothetical protein